MNCKNSKYPSNSSAMGFIYSQNYVSAKCFSCKHRKKSRLREENGFVVVGRILLLVRLCFFPAGFVADRVSGACPTVGKALSFPRCFVVELLCVMNETDRNTIMTRKTASNTRVIINVHPAKPHFSRTIFRRKYIS